MNRAGDDGDFVRLRRYVLDCVNFFCGLYFRVSIRKENVVRRRKDARNSPRNRSLSRPATTAVEVTVGLVNMVMLWGEVCAWFGGEEIEEEIRFIYVLRSDGGCVGG